MRGISVIEAIGVDCLIAKICKRGTDTDTHTHIHTEGVLLYIFL